MLPISSRSDPFSNIFLRNLSSKALVNANYAFGYIYTDVFVPKFVQILDFYAENAVR
jgi:hypothetical protein